MTTNDKIANLDSLCYEYFTDYRTEPAYKNTPEYDRREDMIFELEYHIALSQEARAHSDYWKAMK